MQSPCLLSKTETEGEGEGIERYRGAGEMARRRREKTEEGYENESRENLSGSQFPTNSMSIDVAKTLRPIMWKMAGQVTAWLRLSWRWPTRLVATVTSWYPRDWQRGL